MFRLSPLCLPVLLVSLLPLSCSDDDDPSGSGNGDGDGDITVGDGDGDGDGDQGMGGRTTGLSCTTFSGLKGCGSDGLMATKTKVNILMVLDKSGSMDDPPEEGDTTTLWQATKTAVNQALTDVSSEVAFGLQLYPRIMPKECYPNCCEMPDFEGVDVPIADGQEARDAIGRKLNGTNPGGGTPTAAALARAYEYFDEGEGADLKGGRYVLLATDGGPNCNEDESCAVDACTVNIDGENEDCPPGGDTNCCASLPEACLDTDGVNTQIDKLRSIGVDTFVVGLAGTEKYAEQLDAFAVAGGRPRRGTDYKYYRVDAKGSAEGLSDVLEEITNNLVQSCEIQLVEDPPDIMEVNVAVDCEVIPNRETAQGQGGHGGQGEESTWSLDMTTSPPTAVIDGPLCDKIENEGVDRIDVLFGCPIVR